MELISSIENWGDNFTNGNTIIGAIPKQFLKSSIRFTDEASNNILFIEDGVTLKGSYIHFNGSNSVVFLRKSRRAYNVQLTTHNNNTIAFGSDCNFHGSVRCIASEESNIIFGNDCLLSSGIWIRTGDAHLVYDCDTLERLNPSKSILIGDHVWIGQNAFLLKGTTIGSGSIIGANSVIAGKLVDSNSSWAGNPAKRIRGNLFWDEQCVHSWTPETTKQKLKYSGEPYSYRTANTDSCELVDLDKGLKAQNSSKERLDCLKTHFVVDGSRSNRFAIQQQ